jgi:hypothetical protein
MAVITLRQNKTEALTFSELDTNFTNINTELGAKVAVVQGTAGRIAVSGTTTRTVDLASGVVTAGTTGSATNIPVITVDTYGRITGVSSAANPQGTVTSIVAGTGLSGGTITGSGTISLPTTGVASGTYQGSVTVDTLGRITAATNNLTGYSEGIFNLGNSANPAVNVANGNVQRLTLTGNWAFPGFNTPITGQSVTLIITQDATGSRTISTTGITARWAGGANAGNKTLSTAANSVDILTIFYDGATYYFSLSKGFA